MKVQARQYFNTSALRLMGAALAALALAACDVGEGTRPISMTLLDGNTGQDEIMLNQCFEGSVAAVVEFSNGQAANFLQQGGFPRPVELTSSDESVVRVSDGTLEVPLLENQAYFRGALIPVAPGTATITARYSTFEEQIEVTVQVPESIEIRPGTQTVARGGFQGFDAFAVLDGVERGVTSLVVWSLEDANGNEVDTEQAEISADGLFAGREVSGPFTVNGRLTACATPDLLPPTFEPEDLQAQVSVKEPESLIIERLGAEVDDEGMPPPPVVAGTFQLFRAFATFADPADGRHDVSQQATFDVIEPGLGEDEVSTKAVFLASLGTGSLQALSPTDPDNPLQVRARFGDEEADEELTSNSLPVEIVEATLEAIRISPDDATVGGGFAENFVDYRVDGDYRLEDESVLTLDITRQVTLSSSDTAVAQVTTGVDSPGRVIGVALEPACARITAEILAVPGVASSLLTDQTRLFVIDDTVDCEPEAAP
ncbi:hypothetical protein [Polycyclovorans algicola]|uniref:hypothetical protein n=1 Tax=Polycyclovorans algicola TaxID=616992 RepID=UPI000ABFDDCC|nr:hypothetical protein [Polycyclovorans algicola]